MEQPRRFALAGAWLLAAVLFAGAAGGMLEAGHPLWSSLVAQGVWVGLALALATLLPGRPVGNLGLEPGRLGWVSLLVATAGLLAVSDGLSLLLTELQVRHTGALGEVHRRAAEARGPAFLGALLGLGLAPGIAEELLFRGALQRPLVARFGPGLGVGGAAALFGLAHMDPVHAPAAFVLGLYLGCVARLAGSTRAAIFCHVANNLAATAGSRFGGFELPVDPKLGAPLLLAVGGAALFGVWRRARSRAEAPAPGGNGLVPGGSPRAD